MIREPIVFEPADGVYAVNEFGLDTMFVVCGAERAAVIDTGMGCFDFRALIERITDKPYIVLLTHGHKDHCGGCDQFNAVYLHEADRTAASAVTREGRMDSCRRMKGLEGPADLWDYDETWAREWDHIPEFLDLTDGQRFDLGGRTLTTLFTPGHSRGSCSFIDDKSRILFSGDAFNMNLMVMDCSVNTELNSLLHIQEYQDRFDRNFNGHLGYSSGLSHVSMPKTLLADAIEACRRIIAGTAQPCSTSGSRFAPSRKACTYLYGTVSVAFDPEAVERSGK